MPSCPAAVLIAVAVTTSLAACSQPDSVGGAPPATTGPGSGSSADGGGTPPPPTDGGVGNTVTATCGNYDIIAEPAEMPNPPGYRAVAGTAAGDLYVAGVRGLLHRSPGGAWTNSSDVVDIVALSATAQDVFAATQKGRVMHLSGAAAWTDAVAIPMEIVSLAAVSATEVYAVANGGGAHILHTRDAGASWKVAVISYGLRPAYLTRIWARSAGDVYAVGELKWGTMPFAYVYRSAGDDQWTLAGDGVGMRTLGAIWGVGETTYIGGEGEPFWAGHVLGTSPDGHWIDDGVPYGPDWSPDLPGIIDMWGGLESPLFAVATGVATEPASILLARCPGQGWTRLFQNLGVLWRLWGPPGGRELYVVGDAIHHFRIAARP